MYVPAAPSVARSVPHLRQNLSIFLSVQPVFTRQGSTSSKHLFPFPRCTNPTPYEIFHLPRSASQGEIKTRCEYLFPPLLHPTCSRLRRWLLALFNSSTLFGFVHHRPPGAQLQDYDLVKVYHPDVTHGQHDVAPSVRNARFRAITHAYGILRGRDGPTSNRSAGAWGYSHSRDEAMRAELRRRSRRSRSASSSTTTADSVRHGNTDVAQLRYTLVAFVLTAMIAAMSSVNSRIEYVERHSKSAAVNLAQARAEAQVYGMERRRKIRERVRVFHEAGEMVNGSEHPEMHDTSKGELSLGMTPKNVSNDDRT
ncbi:hypothetical protein J3R83DRAFT_8674 [Lanmaoa asiatica]|nr:hypothetical protein J3R83DRAFT_8674 [Lanmaoa asiatica]